MPKSTITITLETNDDVSTIIRALVDITDYQRRENNQAEIVNDDGRVLTIYTDVNLVQYGESSKQSKMRWWIENIPREMVVDISKSFGLKQYDKLEEYNWIKPKKPQNKEGHQ